MARAPSARQCARALWLFGLPAEPTAEQVNAAYRARIAKAHPDRHGGDEGRRAAAEKLTRALNEARDVLAAWIESGREWPQPLGGARSPSAPADAEREDGAEAAPRPREVCPDTGLAPGDHVRVWPYDGEVHVVESVERSPDGRKTTVRFLGRPPARAHRVRLAAFSCLVCGACGGPAVEEPALRPCPDCLTDLRRLEQDTAEADRIRRAIEARAAAGIAAARVVGDRRLEDRARARRRWAKSLAGAEADDLQRALLNRFTQAYDAWGAAPAAA